jgi:hypothetical protein
MEFIENFLNESMLKTPFHLLTTDGGTNLRSLDDFKNDLDHNSANDLDPLLIPLLVSLTHPSPIFTLLPRPKDPLMV